MEDEEEQDLFRKVLSTKSSEWNYEHEYRWFINNFECFSEGNTYFIRINSGAIVRVDIGVNSNKTYRNKLIKLLKQKKYSHIDIRIAEIDEKEFKLNYRKIELS